MMPSSCDKLNRVQALSRSLKVPTFKSTSENETTKAHWFCLSTSAVVGVVVWREKDEVSGLSALCAVMLADHGDLDLGLG